MYGADLEGIETSERARVIVDGAIPYPDQWFDVVVTNQVFEHVADPPPALREIRRVLKPGGVFIALFPDRSTWFEGHVGLYFVHWFDPRSRVLRAYLMACHQLGLGYFREGKTAAEWANWVRELMITEVFYHEPRKVRSWWTETFGERPQSMAHDWMISRIEGSKRLRRLAGLARQPWMGPFLGLVCRIRAGLVIRIRNRAASPDKPGGLS
jgi:SAM-dependent methyltransferase